MDKKIATLNEVVAASYHLKKGTPLAFTHYLTGDIVVENMTLTQADILFECGCEYLEKVDKPTMKTITK